jgi:hypothetical protein
MCLPLSTLKCLVGFNAWVTIFLGLASLVGGIIVSIRVSGDDSDLYDTLS